MKEVMKFFLLGLMVLLFSCSGEESTGSAEKQLIQIGTGSVSGVYYPTGGAIAKIVNKKSSDYLLEISAISTSGSVFNVNSLMSGDLELGIVQSDRQAEAWLGQGEWEDKGPQENLRSLFSIHSESVSLLVAIDAAIESIEDLKGKKVNIGNPGSGQRANALDILDYKGIDWTSDLEAFSLKQNEAVKMLQEGRLDALFFTVGHPSASFTEATGGRREVIFIPIVDIDSLLKEKTYYTKSKIPIHFYPKAVNEKDVKTFGVKATLCTSAEIPDRIVYAVVKEIFDNLDEFKSLHPAFSLLDQEKMLTGLTAPIHDGALRYYRERGIILE